jgi:exosortase/archaeosortase family protein
VSRRAPRASHVRRAQPAERARSPALRFAVTFAALAVVLFGAYAFPYKEFGVSEGWLQAYLRAYARVAGGVLHIFDPRVVVDGNVVNGRTALSIVKTCDAMEANLLFLAAVLAFPAGQGGTGAHRWRRKLLVALAGVIAISALNVTRICSLYVIGVHFPSAFELFHVELWPLLLIVAAAGLFAIAARYLSRTSAPEPAAA